jgi:hypothetical protein
MPTPLCSPGLMRGMLLCLAAVLASCAMPQRHPPAPIPLQDRNIEYVIVPYTTGFSVVLSYARASCHAENRRVAEVCHSTGAALAYAHAETLHKPIRPLREQDVYLSPDPDISSGITSCMVTVNAEWAR